MTWPLLAHSARPERGIPAQQFWEHIDVVRARAGENARRASDHWIGDAAAFCSEVETAALFHDCGKLAPENQNVLSRSAVEKLPVRHEDAGAALLVESGHERAAMLVASHHAGLPSVPEEEIKSLQAPPGSAYRFRDAMENTAMHLNEFRAEYARRGIQTPTATGSGWTGLTKRIALSTLVDADHTDTARHYGGPVPKEAPKCRWEERLAALDGYVKQLGAERRSGARTRDREWVYQHCRDAATNARIICCDAAVGSGKTTAIMAHLLRVAQERRLRHIFVVLPYTNIIQQSAQTYRTALVLDGEEPRDVVAEVHHRAEFQDPDLREMSVSWDAPVTVTTAVEFFETLAGNRPARLRKLHELPGSAVFLDEAHAAIPVWLWPQTWVWLRELAHEWGCHFVLASGSLARFWENYNIVAEPENVPDLLSKEIQARLAQVEESRIRCRRQAKAMSREQLVQFVANKPGPRLVILNTVQSAAVLADSMRAEKHDVLHLSTALSPADRERVINRVQERLRTRTHTEWTLVATSCVEAGVDFSFRTAIRESCSVASLIQTGGRVARNAEWQDAELWDVRLNDPMFNYHPSFEASRKVLEGMFRDGSLNVDATSVTEALRQELVLREVSQRGDRLRKAESAEDYPEVAKLYKVIDSDTRTVVVDPQLVRPLDAGERVSWRQLLSGSVQMWSYQIRDFCVRRVHDREDLYVWTAAYDPDFLGYMAGVLPNIRGHHTGYYGDV